jgi:hypothetical protein
MGDDVRRHHSSATDKRAHRFVLVARIHLIAVHTSSMSERAERLLRDALQLTTAERARVVAELLASLEDQGDGEHDDVVELAWSAESSVAHARPFAIPMAERPGKMCAMICGPTCAARDEAASLFR